MKKVVSAALLLLTVFLVSETASAAQRGTPEYEALKEYKRQQREKKAGNPEPKGEAKGFWAKEASRSGLAGTAAMFGGAISSAVPFEKPNSRKNQAQ
ncbi:MAG TPA: hypothetical protein VD883_04215 [Candidatus Omnitrophota bacterium]|nr:hypothetical protein [Candidatus Omnitrophota bacterium]